MNMMHVAFHLEDTNHDYNKQYLQAVDILFAIDICLKFVTAYQKDAEWVTDIKLIIVNNFKQKFVFDMTATLPGLITNQAPRYYWFKFVRFIHIRDVFSKISTLLMFLF